MYLTIDHESPKNAVVKLHIDQSFCAGDWITVTKVRSVYLRWTSEIDSETLSEFPVNRYMLRGTRLYISSYRS